jgi:hypothetical protein
MKFAVALIPIVVLLACSSPIDPAKAEPTVNHQQILDRYTHDIWPATSAYNANNAQAGNAAHQFFAAFDPNLTTDQFNSLRDTAQGLGRQGEYDAQDQTTHYNGGLYLGHVNVQAADNGAATLNVCYTYDHSWYVDVADTQHAPGASEATVALINVNNTWYLHAITDDHVVPSCDAATM